MIKDMLPQKEPMVMVSYLKDESVFLEIKDDNIFLDNDIFQEAGILEHIAQSVIVYMYNEDRPTSIQPKIGKISNSEFEKVVRKGEILETKINVRINNDNVIDIEAVSFVNAEKVASTEMLLVL